MTNAPTDPTLLTFSLTEAIEAITTVEEAIEAIEGYARIRIVNSRFYSRPSSLSPRTMSEKMRMTARWARMDQAARAFLANLS